MSHPPVLDCRTLVAVALATLLASCSSKSNSPTSPGSGNHNPTINVTTTTTHLSYGGTATISVSASDQDGDQLSFSYSASGGTVASSGPTATSATFTAGQQWGPASVTVTASDGHGGTAQAPASMYVRNPNAPALTFRSWLIGSCWSVQVQAPEAVTVTAVYVIDPSTAQVIPTDNQFPQTLGPGQTLYVTYNRTNYCLQAGIDVRVRVSRPEPDGGSFEVQWCCFEGGPLSGCQQCRP